MNTHRSNADKFLIVTTLAPPAFGGTPTILGKYLRYFPQGSYCFLADPLTLNTPPVSDFHTCHYHFFDGTMVNLEEGSKDILPTQNVRPRGVKKYPAFDPLKFARRIVRNMVDVPLLVKTVWSGYKTGLKIIADENITSIVAISDSGPAFLISYLLSRKTKRPYSVFLFDIYKGNLFSPFRVLVSYCTERMIISRASAICVAGEGIKVHYEKAYEVACTLIPNSCSIPDEAPSAQPTKIPVAVSYTGSYYWAQQDSIDRLSKAVAGIPSLEFKIFSHDIPGRGGISLQASVEMQRKSDILLLPLSFIDGMFSDVITTAPTGKLAEYLVSGVPILVHAPADSWVSRYVRTHHAGVVVDKASSAAIMEGIEKLKDNNERNIVVKNAYNLAAKNHDVKINGPAFYYAVSHAS